VAPGRSPRDPGPFCRRRLLGGQPRRVSDHRFAEDKLYLRVNDATRPEFERRGMEPFRPFGEDKAMGYCEVPADVVEDVYQLMLWMNQAINVAAEAKRSGKRNAK